MKSKRTNFMVGLFVLIGLIFVAGAIIWLGLASKFEGGALYSAFFDESVQGLNKDSPVKYRGVSIGRVERIDVAADAKLIEVVLKIETNLKPEKDMVAEIKSVGITGIMFVELDRREPGEPDLSPQVSFEPDNPVIATRPSDISQIIGSIDDVLNQLKALDLGGISDRMKTSLETVEHAVTDIHMASLSKEIRDAVANFNKTLAEIDRLAAGMEQFTTAATSTVQQFQQTAGALENVAAASQQPLRETIAGAARAVKRAEALIGSVENPNGLAGAVAAFEQTMKQTDKAISGGTRALDATGKELDSLLRQGRTVLQRLDTATGLLTETLELLSVQPSQLIFSPAPAARVIEPESGFEP